MNTKHTVFQKKSKPKCLLAKMFRVTSPTKLGQFSQILVQCHE